MLLQVWSLMRLESSETNKSRSRKTWRYRIKLLSGLLFLIIYGSVVLILMFLYTDKMLHMWHWKWLLWHDTTWLWDPHFRWTQPGQLHVSVLPLWHSACTYQWRNINMQILFRFFLMYLINKDETEHTGQVSLDCFAAVVLLSGFLLTKSTPFSICVHPPSSSCSYILWFRSRTCGRCTRSVAGTSSLLETVSESNMRISFPSWQVLLYLQSKNDRNWTNSVHHSWSPYTGFVICPFLEKWTARKLQETFEISRAIFYYMKAIF